MVFAGKKFQEEIDRYEKEIAEFKELEKKLELEITVLKTEKIQLKKELNLQQQNYQ